MLYEVMRAKEHGRNNYQFFSGEMNEKVLAKLGMENRLRRALKNNEFYLVYQPQFDLRLKRITGFEALLRWKNRITSYNVCYTKLLRVCDRETD